MIILSDFEKRHDLFKDLLKWDYSSENRVWFDEDIIMAMFSVDKMGYILTNEGMWFIAQKFGLVSEAGIKYILEDEGFLIDNTVIVSSPVMPKKMKIMK